MKQVNQKYVTQLKPNKIRVPFTNGISRIFEDTLIAMLIVLRDVSPTMSIWEAFELRTLASPITYYALNHNDEEEMCKLRNEPSVMISTNQYLFDHLPFLVMFKN